MFNLFGVRRESKVEIVRDHKHLLERMGRFVRQHTPALDALGESQGDVDLALVDRIDNVLIPLIGPSGIDDENWFQSMDYYGDGIRHLEFKPGKFPLNAIMPLKSLLTGEHSIFGILCWAPEAPDGEAGEHEGLVIFNEALLLTPRLARASAHA